MAKISVDKVRTTRGHKKQGCQHRAGQWTDIGYGMETLWHGDSMAWRLYGMETLWHGDSMAWPQGRVNGANKILLSVEDAV